MVARPASPFRSGNAGEMSPDLSGRLDIKQYYSAGLRYKGLQPVPQSGFQLMGGTWNYGKARKPLTALVVTGPVLNLGPHAAGTQTVWSGNIAGAVSLIHFGPVSVNAGTAALQWQVLVGATWVNAGGAFTASADPHAWTAAFAPGLGRFATQARLNATFSALATLTLGAVTVLAESGVAADPRFRELTDDTGRAFAAFFCAGCADFYTHDGWQGASYIAAVTAPMLPDLGFYGEADTIGVFHGSLQSLRLRNFGLAHEWTPDLWPYETIPKVDLGGVYVKTDDVWEINLRWTGAPELFLLVTINGESSAAIPVTDLLDAPIAASSATLAQWNYFAAKLQTALRLLPGMSAGFTLVYVPTGTTTFQRLVLTFSGDLAGSEYQVTGLVSNTAEASALAVHTSVGKTAYEPLFSALRGWPGASTIAQDRLAYHRLPMKTGALALSQTAEYFNIDIESKADSAARLDNIRSITTETVLHVKESAYLIAFTNKAVYYAFNRVLTRNEPLNFLRSSEIGIRPNTMAVELEGLVYYVSNNGEQLMSLLYDDISKNYNADAKSLLASHLFSGVKRNGVQISGRDNDANRHWCLREDGRLIAHQVIRNQEINGICEWPCADGGQVRETGIDGNERLWMAVRRGADMFIELYDDDLLLQGAVRGTPDLAGRVAGLPSFGGAPVWAEADGFIVGPLSETAGSVDLDGAFASAVIGRWNAPVFECMPHVFVTQGDEIIQRPGRIHTVRLHIVDTTSLAIAANGGEPRDIPLLDALDPVDAPMPGKTMLVEVTGLEGFKVDTTFTITQTKPGRLRVKDYATEEKL